MGSPKGAGFTMIKTSSKVCPSQNFSLDFTNRINFQKHRFKAYKDFSASTQLGEKGWDPTRPQAFRRKFFARLVQTGNSLSQLLPLYMDSFGMRSRGSSWEMPCAWQAVVVVCGEVILP